MIVVKQAKKVETQDNQFKVTYGGIFFDNIKDSFLTKEKIEEGDLILFKIEDGEWNPINV